MTGLKVKSMMLCAFCQYCRQAITAQLIDGETNALVATIKEDRTVDPLQRPGLSVAMAASG